VQRWNLPEGWVISRKPAHPALVSEADFIAVQDATAPRGPAGPATRRYLLAGLLACGRCGRRLESAWSNGKPAYRCRHGYTSATSSDSTRPRNTYVREDQILPHLTTVAILLDRDPATFSGTTQITAPRETAALIDQLRDADITLTYDPDTRTLRTGDSSIAAVTVGPDRLHRNNSTRKEEGNPPKAPAVAESRAGVTLTHARKQALTGI
jgi:site-specific DNA recombinase